MSDRKVIDYDIVCAQPVRHADLVLEYFTDGWELYGEPFAVGESNRALFCQGMVKYDGE
jgi:hypothetical protein